ncbi:MULTISPECIES: DUF2170 family protein [Atlantibacter]|uniref:DUF2170 family protein n=1 Tax=Atlantibacter TaxID=1903434 RepID=UPI0019317E3B|nr:MULTISPECIES: DUF2170 family protein [Atlantibacter]MBL7634429.1 DUF2170 family protein [Atlantibacter hermannii]MBL7676590.1 DUF2170 family protein [Atlantibacter hermannii]MCZ7833174.1 YjfI family protein [Atlantibacter hermannii]
MAWTISALQNELNNEAYCCYSVSRLQDSLSLKLKEHGDLLLNISMTSRQMLIETLICPVESIHDVNKLNYYLLRFQKLLPLSSVGITIVNSREYYVAFGALSISSPLSDVILEIETLAENALELAEVITQF